jgi:predicted phage-related endonuclease
MTVGTVMEDWIAEQVEAETGWKLRRRAPVKGMEHEGAHIDRHIVAFDDRGPGVLEIKCVGRQSFWSWVFDGVPQAYILQLQWYMRLTGWTWGAIAVWNREHDGDGRVKVFEFASDDELMALVSDRVDEFWSKVEDGIQPPVLEPRDTRCDGCEYGHTCRAEEWAMVDGEERRDDLIQIVQEYDEAREVARLAEANQERARELLTTALGDAATTYAGAWKVTFKPQESTRVDPVALRRDFPDVWAKVAVKSMSRPLRVTTKKETK